MATVVALDQQQRAGASSMSSPAPPGLRVLDTALVLPSPSAAPPPECSLPLTFMDIFWLTAPPVERLFLYRLAPDADVPAILSGIRYSLSQAVRAFYPLAGRLRLTPGSSNGYELYYCPGDGVAFTAAEYDADIDELAVDGPRDVAGLSALVPPLPAGGAVLALQATLLLPARRGLAIGVTVHHAACDGSGSTHFLHTWAAAACARADADAPPPPVIDRSLLPDPRGLYKVFCPPAPVDGEREMELSNSKAPAAADDKLFATFTVSKDDAQRVKDAVAAEAARRGVAPPRCTSLVATLGLVWSCHLRAKADQDVTTGGGAGMIFPVDHRSRMKPPLPDKYFGNCVGPAFCLLPPRDELAAAGGVGGLFSACAAVAAGIDEAVGGIGTSAMDAWEGRIIGIARSNIAPIGVAGSPRFRVYDLDMGFGRPAKVDVVSAAKTGSLALAESRHGAGGIEVGVSLPRDGMDRFHKCFADAIAAVQSQPQLI